MPGGFSSGFSAGFGATVPDPTTSGLTDIRTAIITGLAAREAWNDVTLFKYPAGDRAERPSGFELGSIESAEHEDITLAGTTHQASYTLNGDLWVSGAGAEDADFATVEAAALTLLQDLQAWIVSVDHGKSAGVDTLDILDLVSWELNFTAAPAAVIEFALNVVEYI